MLYGFRENIIMLASGATCITVYTTIILYYYDAIFFVSGSQ